MKTKICTKCKIEKLVNEFYKDKSKKDNFTSQCKKCQSEYYQKNSERIKKVTRKWRENNPEKVKVKNEQDCKKYKNSRKQSIIKYRENHKKEAREYHIQYRQNNKAKLNKYQKERRKNNPIYRLNQNISFSIWASLKGKKNRHSWNKLVGYDTLELKEHLEKQFKEGMTWENYGKWHIDHRIPISLFNIKSIKSKGFKAAWKLDNLQPLWAEDNLKKHNTLFY